MQWHYRLQQPGPLSWWQLDENTRNYEITWDALSGLTASTQAAANFKGNWSALTGPLAVPASVYHNSQYWMLRENVANVAAEVPGVSTKWAQLPSVMGPASATNNAVATFDGTTGKLLKNNAGVIVDSNGRLLSVSNLMGYGVGAGGQVTQDTSKSTAVALNKPSGRITMHAESLAANDVVRFAVNNLLVLATDIVCITGVWGAVDSGNYRIEVARVSNNVFTLRVTNITVSARAEALQIGFAIIRGSTS